MNAASIGSKTLERAVCARMAACKLNENSDYWSFLEQTPSEVEQLIEEVVVPETWFFRDREPFNALTHFAQREWLPAHATGDLRVLSAPCATGEEPYSISMALLDAGVQRFQVDAVDISKEALAIAERATYGRNSFRGKDLVFRERYFQKSSQGHVLKPSARERVRFHCRNLIAPDFWPERDCFDVIFCRNVLIYFDRATQQRVVQMLGRLLRKNGILFVGHGETGLMVESDFESAKLPMAFAYRKGRAPKTAAVPNPRPRARPSSSELKRFEHEGEGPGRIESPPSPGIAVERFETETNLKTASRLADAGKLEEALRLCEKCLEAEGPSAAAYYLLGMLCDAKGEKEKAAQYYRKAIYLQPDHYEALLHLALLAERAGDKSDAHRWHQRAERVHERSKV